MSYIDDEVIREAHSIEQISNNRIDANIVLNMMTHAQIPYQYGATEESIIENMKYVRFYLFKDSVTDELLVCPDLLEVEIENPFEGENGEIVYNTFRKIVSYRDFTVALDRKGFQLDVAKIEELLPYVNGNEVTVNLSKKACKRHLVRM
jgi:hypothetical protein